MYGKLFASMYDGSLAMRGPWQALITLQQLIILADREGYVDMTTDAIARRTTLPAEIIATGIEALLQPDPDSRRPDCSGRRIEPIDPARNWGWRIVNYAYYRALRTAEERRDYMREHQRKRRANITAQAHPPMPAADDSPILAKLPMRSGDEFDIRQSWVDQLAPLYPAVDVTQTCHEMRGWLLGNPERRKTPRGIRAFITRWLQREQDRHGRQAPA